ncbi:MAG: 50S ribosomal protein L4 [Planctomycetota bacterium]|nr:50S ribosomal protein L4 [Planctomycetota bacterium]
MVTLPVYDLKGSEVGKIDVDPDAIAPKINKQLLHDVVVMYLANKRQGTKRTKPRGEVSGTTKKLFRQKGTGNARAGSKRAPHRRGGGHAMQLRPRSFYYRLPKKAIKTATKMAIASKFADSEVVVVDKIEMESPSTRSFAGALQALGLTGSTATVALGDYSKEVHLSARNIQGVQVTRVADLNALDILRPKKLVLTKDAVEWIQSQANGAAA